MTRIASRLLFLALLPVLLLLFAGCCAVAVLQALRTRGLD
jgi:hypothetical protein